MPSGSLILLPMSSSSVARSRTIFGAAESDHLIYVNKRTGFQGACFRMSIAPVEEAALKEEIRVFLRSHHVVSLAVLLDGTAHAACVMYALEDVSLVWTSDTDSRHSLAIERNAQVAATVAPDYEDFRLIRGLQIAGRARRLDDAGDAAHAGELLRGRFRFLRELQSAPAALRAATAKAAYYRLDPDTITLIDNTRGFGNKRTLRMP
jgi:uncharacterized protein YhbP (UPF0306 family)